MATTHQDTNVNQLVINKLTKQEYDNLSQVSENELWLVEEQLDNTVTQGSTNPVQSGAVYEAIQDIGGNINDGTTMFVKNNRTVGTTSANQALDKTITIPNDIIMCKMSDGIVYDSYITYTKIKQYLPDYPYYSDDLNWEIGGNPPMRASITEGNYYLDVDTNHIFVADEILELLDITSSVVIHGDPNKLYCDVDTNILYRYDGTNFVALTSNFSGDYNDLINKPDLNFLKQRDLTTYQGENDEIVQHIGSTDINFTNGYIYKNKNVHTLTYYNENTQFYNTYSYYGETLDNVTFELFKVTQDNINYVIPTNADIGDNFWVVDNFNDLNVIHVFIIDDCGNDTEGIIDYTGHFLATNITLTINVPYQYVSVTSKASIYKNGNNYLYCPINDFKYLAQSISNNKANCIPPTITVNDFYKWQLNNVQPNQLSLENSKVKYTLSDNTTKLTLAQESDLKKVAFSGSYNDLTNKPQNATTTTAGLMSADDKYLLVFFKTITITSLSTAIPPNTPIGLIRVSTNIVNINIRTYGSWNVGTMGQLCFDIAGRPQYGYGIAQSGICYTRTSLTLKCGLKNGEVYIWVVFPGTSYNSDCQFFIEGFAAYSSQSLNYAILDESEFSMINYLNINAI